MSSLRLTKNNIEQGLYKKPSPKYSEVALPVLTMNDSGASKTPDWGDFVYRYFPDVDALKLFFIRTVPGLVRDTEDFDPGVVIDYTANGQIVVVEIEFASKLLACDLVDAPYTLVKDGKQPMQLCPYYDGQKDCFDLFFLNPDMANPTEEVKIEGTKIIILYNSKHQIVGMKFQDATNTICKKKV
jgi:uncharacterized protein YuzE